MSPDPRRIHEPGDGTYDLWDLPTDEPTLYDLLGHTFTTWWPSIRFGVLVPGAAWEIRAERAPTLGLLDGYATIDFDTWPFHLCIGTFVGSPHDPLPPHLAEQRRTGRAELGRGIANDGAPTSWFLRLWTGAGHQQLTVLLPNPFLDDDQNLLPEPRWDRLDAWDDLRRRYLDLGPDPINRSGRGFRHQ